MDRLMIMKTFTVIIETGKFSAAARKLGISRALVSHHVSTLEKQLGARLLNRTTRSIVLTEAGTQYYEFSKRILADIDAEDASLASVTGKAEGALAVVSPKWIGGLDLGDAIAAFAARNPRIRVRLDLGVAGMSVGSHRFVDEGYDVAFHTKPMRNSGLVIKRIATLRFVLCASPAYLKGRRLPQRPEDLSNHSCLVHADDPVWRFRVDGELRRMKAPNVVFSSNTYLVLRKAALEGLGIVAIPFRSVHADVQAGALKTVLADYPLPDRPLYVAAPPGRHRLPKVRCFIDFISEWFGAPPV